MWILLRQFLEKIGLLFTPTSGHTAHDTGSQMCRRQLYLYSDVSSCSARPCHEEGGKVELKLHAVALAKLDLDFGRAGVRVEGHER